MPRKPKNEDEGKKFNGSIGNLANFASAIKDIHTQMNIPEEEITKIIVASIDKAFRDTKFSTKAVKIYDKNHNLVKLPSEASLVKSETVIDPETGKITFYQLKDVVSEVEDDVYQIEPDEANEQDPSHEYQVGDVFKIAYPLSEEDSSFNFTFFNKVKANIEIKIKDAVKEALFAKYDSRIGHLINATVESIDRDGAILSIAGVNATLTNRNMIPVENLIPGQQIKVLLSGIGSPDKKYGDKGTTLLVTRTNDLFLQRLFEEEIPDIADGTIKIEKIAREAGNRSKVAVSSTVNNVDPTGACIGTDGSRIKNIISEINGEKIDVVKYSSNKYLYIAEALKPASVVGVLLKDDEPVPENKAPKAVAVVKNEESRVAIGRGGINVRLASKITGYSIDVKELDAALSEHISFKSIDDIKKQEAIKRLAEESESIEDVDTNKLNEEGEEEDEIAAEQYVKNFTPELQTKPEEDNLKEEVKEDIKEDEVNKEVVPETNKEPVQKEVEEEKPEYVEITSKAKISLSELEAQMEEEKKKKNVEPSYKRYKKDDKKKEEVKDNKAPSISNAMPIYTQEELDEIEQEEQQNQEEQDDNDYSEYDDDHYYDEDK